MRWYAGGSRTSSRWLPLGGHDAVLDDEHAVGAVEQQRARGDDDGRGAGAVLDEALGDAGLGVGVDGARRVDEDEDLGVAQQRPDQREPLALAAGERAAPLLELAVEPAVDRVDGVGRVRGVQGLR